MSTTYAGATGPRSGLPVAHTVALLLPTALLGGALASQYWGGLHPCQMCLWQRWPHLAAIGIGLVALIPGVAFRRSLVALAAVAIAASGAIGVYHAGVEWHWWLGPACSRGFAGAGLTGDDLLKAMMAAPVIACDVAQYRFLGISLAGWNAILSLGGAAAVVALLRRGRPA